MEQLGFGYVEEREVGRAAQVELYLPTKALSGSCLECRVALPILQKSRPCEGTWPTSRGGPRVQVSAGETLCVLNEVTPD